MARQEIRGKKVLVVGLGRFGGQIAAARWLVDQGADVTITDLAPREKLVDAMSELADLPLKYRLGGHDPDDLDGCDLMVVSPAVPKDRSEFIRAAVTRGIALTAEMNLFLERCPARRIIGVTGTAGKSTTTAMIGSILQAAHAAGVLHQVWTGGNIGHSLLSDLRHMSPEDVVVLELSSFQLEDLGSLRWSPSVAVITNLQPNHLDRHPTLDAYADAKMNIVRYQRPDDVVIVPRGDGLVREYVTRAGAWDRARECTFEAGFADVLNVPGHHNRLNAAAAVAAARAVGLNDEVIVSGLRQFTGLPHRLELVAEIGGVHYYNDSKSTTPQSTEMALDAFAGLPVIMLVGGSPKGASFAGMGRLLAEKCKAVICYGQTGPQIHSEVLRDQSGCRAEADLVSGLAGAVRQARQLAAPGDVVVLSPACASYDEFNNYEERGEAFRRMVTQEEYSI